MRKLLLAALLCGGVPTLSFAQATLTVANMNPTLGDVYVNNICDTTGVVPNGGGAGVTWNFSGLTLAATGTTIDTAKAEACSATPYCALFSGSTAAIVSTSAIEYVITTTNKLQQKGYYNSATQNAVYSDPIDQFRYPFTYGSSFIDTGAGIITFTTSGVTVIAAETSVDTVKCDGYGTLILPGGLTYSNVLRVHTSQPFRDSANLFGTPVIETYQVETYTWYTPNYHSPLLTIATAVGDVFNYKLVSYSAKKIITAVTNVNAADASLTVFPNPATDMLNLRFTAATGHTNITLTDMAGRIVATIADKDMQGAQQIAYNTSALAKGMYLVRLQSGTETTTQKVVLQ